MTTTTEALRQKRNEVSLARERIDHAAQAEAIEKKRVADERAQLEAQEAKLADQLVYAEFDEAIPYNRQLVDTNRAAVDELAAMLLQPSITWDAARRLAKTIDDTFQRQQAHKSQRIGILRDHFANQYPMTDKDSEFIQQKHAIGTQLGQRGIFSKMTDAWPIWGAILQAFNAAGAEDKLFYQAQAIGYALTGVAFQRRPDVHHPELKWDIQSEVTRHLSMPQRPLYGG